MKSFDQKDCKTEQPKITSSNLKPPAIYQLTPEELYAILLKQIEAKQTDVIKEMFQLRPDFVKFCITQNETPAAIIKNCLEYATAQLSLKDIQQAILVLLKEDKANVSYLQYYKLGILDTNRQEPLSFIKDIMEVATKCRDVMRIYKCLDKSLTESSDLYKIEAKKRILAITTANPKVGYDPEVYAFMKSTSNKLFSMDTEAYANTYNNIVEEYPERSELPTCSIQ